MTSPSRPPCGAEELLAVLGNIDIYVLDQIMRGRITPDMRILDAGCGGGRNSEYLMRCGAHVFGVDADPQNVDRIRAVAARVAPDLPRESFGAAQVEALPFPDDYFGAVICSAVLHFARDEEHFEAMVGEMWRVLSPGGVFFARLASTIGLEAHVVPISGRRHHIPDGSDRFLVDEAYLKTITEELGGEWLDPLKTTNVQNLRAMSTWVLQK